MDPMRPGCVAFMPSRPPVLRLILIAHSRQLVSDVAELKASVVAAKEEITAAKEKQKQAKDDIKRLEKDMDDFKRNKDSKLNELKVRHELSARSSTANEADALHRHLGCHRQPTQGADQADSDRQVCA